MEGAWESICYMMCEADLKEEVSRTGKWGCNKISVTNSVEGDMASIRWKAKGGRAKGLDGERWPWNTERREEDRRRI